jgi:hypothetical protein
MKDALTASVTADELPTVGEYRPLALSSVFALLLGLASPLVLANPILAIVPLAAAIVSVVALRQIAAASEGLSGKRLATAGLCLAALFLGWGLAGHFHHQAHVRQTAREFADDWLRVVSEGDLPRAYQLHVAREYRQDPHSIKSRPTSSGLPDPEITDFFNDPAVKAFVAAGPDVRFRFEETVHQSSDSLADRVVLKYTFDTKEGRLPLWLTVRRTFSNSRRHADWEIYSALNEPRVP